MKPQIFILLSLLALSPLAHAEKVMDSFSAEIKVEPTVKLTSFVAQAYCLKSSFFNECSDCECHEPRYEPAKQSEPLRIEYVSETRVRLSLARAYRVFEAEDCYFNFSVKAISPTDGAQIEASFVPANTSGNRADLEAYFSRFDLALDPVLHESTNSVAEEIRLIERSHRDLNVIETSKLTPRALVDCKFNPSTGASWNKLTDLDAVIAKEYQMIDASDGNDLVGKITNWDGRTDFYLGMRSEKNNVLWVNQEGPHVELWNPDHTLISCHQKTIADEVLDLNVPTDAKRAKYYLSLKPGSGL
jgi:hypothetical protein